MASRKSSAGALALALVSAVSTPAMADEKAPSPFVLCDGRVGHVSDGARFLRLLLVSATAGLSETAMSRDDAAKRAKGAAGVAACDQAIRSEGDPYRRIQLALARSLHFAEDKQWTEASAAAGAVPQQLGTRAGDWGLSKSAAGTAGYLQALFFVRAGKTAEAEAAAWSAATTAGLDVVTMQRMQRFAGLSRSISPQERTVLQTMQRYYPESVGATSNAYAWAGDFKSAAAAIRGFETAFDAFIKDPKPTATVHSELAALAALDGSVTEAKAELAIAKDALERARNKGEAISESASFASREDEISFAEAAVAAASGDNAQAAKTLGTRNSWPTVAQGLVAALVGRVAPQVPEGLRQGVLAKTPDQIWQATLDARLALLRNTDKDATLWNLTAVLQQDEGYQKLARDALSGGSKSKWLVKAKEPRDFEILVTDPENFGWESGEALWYHAALMAKARGKQGFVVLPVRARINSVAVRFVDPGELGIAPSSIVMADEVIAALSPHIRETQQ